MRYGEYGTLRFDYLLHVAVEDLNRLGKLVKADIASIPGVGKSETFLILSEIKPDEGLPIGDLINERAHVQKGKDKTKPRP